MGCRRGLVQCVLMAKDPDRSIPEFGVRDTEHHPSGGEGVCEVEMYLDIVRLTSTHSLGSRTCLLERGCTLFQSGVAFGKRQCVEVGILGPVCWSFSQ